MTEAEVAPATKERKGSSTRDRNRLLLALAIDLLVALAAAAGDGNFLVNFAFYWLPHPPLLLILWWFKPRRHPLIGTTYGLAITTALFGALSFLKVDTSATLWSWYLISLPGAAIGGLLGYIFIPRRKQQPSKKIIALTCMSTVVGTLLALTLGLSLQKVITTPGNDDKKSGPRRRRAPADEPRPSLGFADFPHSTSAYMQAYDLRHPGS